MAGMQETCNLAAGNGGRVQAIMSTYFLPAIAESPAKGAKYAADAHMVSRSSKGLEETSRLLFVAHVGQDHYVCPLLA